jgi:quinol monooxygenase YgiN
MPVSASLPGCLHDANAIADRWRALPLNQEKIMIENISFALELAVNPGPFEDLKTLMAELVAANRKEVGMLTQEWAVSDDGQVCHIYERFQDSAAAIAHLELFGANFAKRLMEIFKPTRIVIYGTPSVEVKDAYAAFNPVYLAPLAGFRKQ